MTESTKNTSRPPINTPETPIRPDTRARAPHHKEPKITPARANRPQAGKNHCRHAGEQSAKWPNRNDRPARARARPPTPSSLGVQKKDIKMSALLAREESRSRAGGNRTSSGTEAAGMKLSHGSGVYRTGLGYWSCSWLFWWGNVWINIWSLSMRWWRYFHAELVVRWQRVCCILRDVMMRL